MHIMHMLGIVSLVFVIGLFFLCFFREKLNHRIINLMFILADGVFLFSWTYAMYEHNGLKGGFMTLDNISPFICTVIVLVPLMNKKLREFAYAAIAFLGFGMFLAMFISPEVEYLFNYHQDAKFMHVSEAACHLIMGLYGFYLILSNRVSLTLKSCGKALAFIYSAIGLGLFLNYFFHRSYFGMDMYGNYSIYFLDIFGSFEATLIAYLLGVFMTIALGFLIGLFLDWLSTPKPNKEDFNTSPVHTPLEAVNDVTEKFTTSESQGSVVEETEQNATAEENTQTTEVAEEIK